MKLTRKKTFVAAGAVAAGAIGVAVAVASPQTDLTGVPSANTKSAGLRARLGAVARAVTRSPSRRARRRSRTRRPPSSYYGYDNDTLNPAGQPVMVASTASGNTEAHKTEPDKNTYLVFDKGLQGADPSYDYGTHFLFQGHETGAPGYITRINLDADAAHRVTVLATQDRPGNADRRHRRLDLGSVGAAAAVHDGERERADLLGHAGLPVAGRRRLRRARARRLRGHPGRLATATSGSSRTSAARTSRGRRRSGRTASSTATCPTKPGDLANGKLQVLQVLNGTASRSRSPRRRRSTSPDQVALHTYGQSFDTKWITIHDTAVDGTAPFNANTLAKAADGTPFKRPENGLFRPDGEVRRVLLRRDRRHERDQPRERLLRWLDVGAAS